MTDFRDQPGDGTEEPQPLPRRSAESAASAASAVEPREVSTTPAGTPEPTGSWRKVAKAPAAVTDPDPVQDAGVPDAPPPIPTWVKWTGLGGVAVLLLLALWLGMTLGAPGPSASPTPSATPEPTPAWPLAAPQVVGEFVQGEESESMDPADENRRIVRSTYSDGTDRLVLLLSRPESDLRSYLSNAGVSQVSEVGESSCGTSADTGSEVCVRIVDETAIMLVGLTDQTQDVLAGDLADFYEVLSG